MLIFVKRSNSFSSWFLTRVLTGKTGGGERGGVEQRPGDEVGGGGQEVEVRLYVTLT